MGLRSNLSDSGAVIGVPSGGGTTALSGARERAGARQGKGGTV